MSTLSSKIRIHLLDWYHQYKRDLPWRHTKDPYAIWLSEIMLQQTTVATVIPYYQKFLKKFPTLQSIAKADEAMLLKMWQGLGYYNRIRNFKKAAQKITTELKGRVPQTKNELIKLPGLGDYTAAAVASIAYDEAVAVLDGNVMRVLARLDEYDQEIKTPQAKKELQQKADTLLDPDHAGDFNQAMMELGATVCSPKNPKCLICPINQWCQAYQHRTVEQFPVNTKKIAYQDENSLCVVYHYNDKVLLRRRQKSEIMAGMWEFPLLVVEKKARYSQKLAQKLVAQNKWPPSDHCQSLAIVRHSIMNRRMKVHPVMMGLTQNTKMQGDWKWVAKKNLDKVPLTTVTRKVLGLV